MDDMYKNNVYFMCKMNIDNRFYQSTAPEVPASSRACAVAETGGHWFHTEGQLAVLRRWTEKEVFCNDQR